MAQPSMKKRAEEARTKIAEETGVMLPSPTMTAEAIQFPSPNMTKQQRNRIRNDLLMADYVGGLSIHELATKYRVSVGTTRNIITAMKKGGIEWSTSLSKDRMILLHKMNTQKVYNETRRLENIRDKCEELSDQARMTKDLIDCIVKYDAMVATGEYLRKTQDIVEEARRVIRKAG